MVWTLPADNHMRITWVTKHRRLLAKRRARSRVLRKPRALKLRRMVKHLDQQQEDPPHEKLKAKHAAPHVAGPADDSDMHLDDETLVLGGISPVSTLSWGSAWETDSQYQAYIAAAELVTELPEPPVPHQFSPYGIELEEKTLSIAAEDSQCTATHG